MALTNPAFSTNPAFQNNGQAAAAATLSAENLEQMYEAPSATAANTDRMTIEDTINKTAIAFGLLVAGAVVGWMVPALYIPAAIAGFVLALVNIFKKKPSPALILSYAGVQGLFVGGISAFFESRYPGIVVQAVIGTLAVVGVTLALFASGKVRASAKATKIFMIAMFGYLAYSLLNVILVWTGVTSSAFGLSSDVKFFGIPLGVVIGVVVVIMGAYSLVLDFDFIQRGAATRLPRVYGWTGAFGIMVTVIWLYLEILRLLAISRD